MINIGSISTGTMRPQDLLRTFAAALEQYGDLSKDRSLIHEAKKWADHMDEHETVFTAREYQLTDDLVNDLDTRLNEIAAPYNLRFGAHEGDGSDFGFWEVEDEPIEGPEHQLKEVLAYVVQCEDWMAQCPMNELDDICESYANSMKQAYDDLRSCLDQLQDASIRESIEALLDGEWDDPDVDYVEAWQMVLRQVNEQVTQ